MATKTAQAETNVSTPEPGSPAAIRAWANENGHEVGVRGRISSALREQYEAATAKPKGRKRASSK